MNGQSSAQYSSLRHKNEKYTQNDSKKLLRPPSPAFSKWHLVRVCGSVLGKNVKIGKFDGALKLCELCSRELIIFLQSFV